MANSPRLQRRDLLRSRARRGGAVVTVVALLAIASHHGVVLPAGAEEPPPLPISSNPAITLAGTGEDAHPESLAGVDPGPGPLGHDHAVAGDGAALPGTVADGWSSTSTFRTADGWYASPIHATLLPDGRIFYVGVARNADPPTASTPVRRVAWIFTPPAIGQPIPPTTTIQEIAEPAEVTRQDNGTYTVNDDFYCMGATLTADGKVVTAGGTRSIKMTDTGILHTLGLPYQTIFDGTSWVRQPGTMLGTGLFNLPTRWYPTLTRLPDKRILVTGGLEAIVGPDNVGYANRSIETYDPATGNRTLFSDIGNTPPAIQARDYAHVFVLPYATAPNDILIISEAGIPIYLNANQPGAFALSTPRPGNGGTSVSWGASEAMLPIRVQNGQWGYVNGTIVTAGGDMHTQFERSLDVYDPLFGWHSTADLGTARHHPSTVVLADGRVLIVNGHDMDDPGPAVQQAQYVDPAHGFSISAGTAVSGVTRGYHSTAILLPDGRVLIGGGRDIDTKTSLEKPTYQIYTPDYLSRTRPTMIGPPSTIGYGSLFAFGASGPIPTEVELVALGSMTHSFDANQRVIQLPMGLVPGSNGGPSLVVAGGPADTHIAPPGDYMLVTLGPDRTPSEAKIVRLA